MIFNLHLFAASLCISLNFISCFFGVLSLKMTKKQVFGGILLTLVWGYILAVLSWYMEADSVFLISIIVEIGYMIIAILTYAKGNFWYNCFSVMVVSWLLNFINLLLVSIVDFQSVKFLYQITGGYLKIDIWRIVLMALLNIVFAIPVSQFTRKIVKKDGSYEGFYRFFMIAFIVENVVQGIFQVKNAGEYEWFYIHHDIIYYLYAVVCMLIFCFVYLYTTRRDIINREKQLRSVLTLAKKQYESSVEKNKEYHLLRHEWNRQVGMLMQKESLVSQTAMEALILHAKSDIESVAITPYSGNVYLDMVLERYTRMFNESEKMLEIHIESQQISHDFSLEIAQMVDEILGYIWKYEGVHNWCLVGIHKKGDYWICQLEYEHDAGRIYYFKKLMQLIGNNLIMRQRLLISQAIVDERDGAVLYYLEKTKANFAIMIKE